MKTLSGKVALVTGATGGIGRSTAELLAKHGVKVVVTGRREKEGQETVQLIEQAGSEGHFVQGDISVESDVKRMVDETVAKFGKMDIAVNNAGVEVAGPTLGVERADFDRVFGINVWGVLASLKYEIPVMLNNGGGSIISM